MVLMMSDNQPYSRKYAPSPPFQYSNASSISSTNQVNVSWESYNTSSKKYLPFNFVTFSNNSNVGVTILPNQDASHPLYIPAKTIISVDESSVQAWYSFGFVPDSSTTINANELKFTFSKSGQKFDSIAQRAHERIFGGTPKNLI